MKKNDLLIGGGALGIIAGVVGSFVSDKLNDSKKQNIVNVLSLVALIAGFVVASIGLDDKLSPEIEDDDDYEEAEESVPSLKDSVVE